ncbi:hypothetical protein VP01_367g1 [Puccinia sorghi]|uniref:Uncharacterized protein n=1 Tax=Puccinia sorghi TaxID=27349 RepID=A0A0L6UUB4_9BASI|nr:hypothetical protein VP01_367g1 [Puccinia sorghi]
MRIDNQELGCALANLESEILVLHSMNKEHQGLLSFLEDLEDQGWPNAYLLARYDKFPVIFHCSCPLIMLDLKCFTHVKITPSIIKDWGIVLIRDIPLPLNWPIQILTNHEASVVTCQLGQYCQLEDTKSFKHGPTLRDKLLIQTLITEVIAVEKIGYNSICFSLGPFPLSRSLFGGKQRPCYLTELIAFFFLNDLIRPGIHIIWSLLPAATQQPPLNASYRMKRGYLQPIFMRCIFKKGAGNMEYLLENLPENEIPKTKHQNYLFLIYSKGGLPGHFKIVMAPAEESYGVTLFFKTMLLFCFLLFVYLFDSFYQYIHSNQNFPKNMKLQNQQHLAAGVFGMSGPTAVPDPPPLRSRGFLCAESPAGPEPSATSILVNNYNLLERSKVSDFRRFPQHSFHQRTSPQSLSICFVGSALTSQILCSLPEGNNSRRINSQSCCDILTYPHDSSFSHSTFY